MLIKFLDLESGCLFEVGAYSNKYGILRFQSPSTSFQNLTALALQVNVSIHVYAKEKFTLVGTAYFPSVRETA